MQMKQVWAQQPTKKGGYVALPINLNHRLAERGTNYAWSSLMKEVDEVGFGLHDFSLAVAAHNKELSDEERQKKVVRWCAQVETHLINKIATAPKLSETTKLQDQEDEMRRTLAEIIATRFIELVKISSVDGPFLDQMSNLWETFDGRGNEAISEPGVAE